MTAIPLAVGGHRGLSPLDEEWQVFQAVNDLAYYWSIVELLSK